MRDLYDDPGLISLHDTAQITADTNTKYIDTVGLDGVGFIVVGIASTASAGNTFTPKIYGYSGTAPGTASNYTLLDTSEYQGSFSAIAATGHFLQKVALKQKNYRYYYIKLDEDGTADITVCVLAEFLSEAMPSQSVTPTTGTVT